MKYIQALALIWVSIFILNGCEADTASLEPGESGTSSSTHQADTASPEPRKSSTSSGTYKNSTPSCNDCGTVVSIVPVTVKGDGSGVGAVVGAVVGGLLGNQVGGGSGKKAATVVGVVGGAVAGNEIEKQTKRQTYHDVAVKMDSGAIHTVSVESVEFISIGSPVRVMGNNLELR